MQWLRKPNAFHNTVIICPKTFETGNSKSRIELFKISAPLSVQIESCKKVIDTLIAGLTLDDNEQLKLIKEEIRNATCDALPAPDSTAQVSGAAVACTCTADAPEILFKKFWF